MSTHSQPHDFGPRGLPPAADVVDGHARRLARSVATTEEWRYAVEQSDDASELEESLARRLGSRRALAFTTPTVARLHATEWVNGLRRRGADLELRTLAIDESRKAMDAVLEVCESAAAHGLRRDSVLIAIGGGVCSDVVTVAASLVRRGIEHMRVPTTLLAQVDAAVGAKGAVNLPGRKNHLGCFHPPSHVVVHPPFLATLPPRELASGMAEIVKVAAVADEALFARLEAEAPRFVREVGAVDPNVRASIVWRAIELIVSELEPNLFERRSWRRTMDFGHTFGPHLEARPDSHLRHGEAVAVDMALSAAIAAELELCDAATCARIVRLLVACELPIRVSALDVSTCRAAMAETSRHRGGALNLVVPAAIGSAAVIESASSIDDGVLKRAFERLEGGAC